MKSLPLSQGRFSLVDDDDYDYLMQWRWTYSGGYAYRLVTKNKKSRKVWLHRVVNKTPENLFTDHINCDRLDNRKENLRTCTYAENNKNAKIRKDNKSGYRGVYWEKNIGKWRVVINYDGKRECLGFFLNAEEAASKYNEVAEKVHGQFARFNVLGGALSK